MGSEYFSKVDFYIPASSKYLGHNGCWVNLLKMMKKLYIFSSVFPMAYSY